MPTNNASKLTQTQINAITSLTAMFETWGMTKLGNAVVQAVQEGYSVDTIKLGMQTASKDPALNALHQSYEERFSANSVRIKAGLPPLAPDAYVAVENSYRNILQDSGLPKGFYDNPDDFSALIAKNIEPTQLQQRVNAASKAIENTDPYYTQSLKSMYGLTNGDMIAHLLDPERASSIIAKQAKAVEYGAAAARQGLAQAPVSQYEAYAGGLGTGVNPEAGMAQIASITPGLTALAQIGGTDYNQATAEQEVFGGLASAQRARQKLTAEEEARFTGRSNIDPKSLQGDTAGQL